MLRLQLARPAGMTAVGSSRLCGAEDAAPGPNDRFPVLLQLPCRTVVSLLSALVGRWPRLPASRDTVGCHPLAAPAMPYCLKLSSWALEPRMVQRVLGTLRDQGDSISLHASCPSH